VIVFLVVTLLLLGACASGGVEKTESAPTQPNEGPANTGPGNAAPSGGSAFDKLKAAMGGKPAKYTADYELTTSGQTIKETMSFDLPRLAVKMTSGTVQSWTIVNDKTIVACTKQASWQCFTVTNQEAPKDPAADLQNSLNENPGVTLTGACSRAGETGMKFKVVMNDASSDYCVTTDGIMLETTSTSAGQTMSMVATRVSRGVSEADFTPPATPVDMATYQQQLMAGQGLPAGVQIPS
jgi:hypothetical protein